MPIFSCSKYSWKNFYLERKISKEYQPLFSPRNKFDENDSIFLRNKVVSPLYLFSLFFHARNTKNLSHNRSDSDVKAMEFAGSIFFCWFIFFFLTTQLCIARVYAEIHNDICLYAMLHTLILNLLNCESLVNFTKL